jgi:hypothetical protein
VTSSMRIGQTPNEWWSRLPTAGHASSTSRMREAPTTHDGYSHASRKTRKTSSGVQRSTRVFLAMGFPSSLASFQPVTAGPMRTRRLTGTGRVATPPRRSAGAGTAQPSCARRDHDAQSVCTGLVCARHAKEPK